MMLYYLYAVSAVLIALGYMLFDVLNKREVPNLFAYLTLIFAFAVILFTYNVQLIIQSYLIAFVILGFGYFVYKIGQLGLGDVFEFAVLSLVLAPIAVPLIPYATTWVAMPPIVSLFLDTGIAAIISVPLFYIAAAAKKMGREAFIKSIRGTDVIKAVSVVGAYLLLSVLLFRLSYAREILIILLFLIVLGSAMLLVFQRAITEAMVEHVDVTGFVEEDIIAFNLMSKEDIAATKKKVKTFDRLITKQLIAEMKDKKVKDKFPVYKRAVPFAVPIFLGTILTIVAGNLLLLAILG